MTAGVGLRVDGVAFAYGKRQVLSGVSFEVPKGQVWGLLGRSGCGKTTLLHVLSGLYRPSEGAVHVDGRAPGPGSIRGVVFQEECLLGWLDVEGNVLFPAHRVAAPALRERAQRLLGQVGLGEVLREYPHELSTGMRKRLEVARAIIADDEYFLADEPFGTVDYVTRLAMWRMWRDLRRREARTGILCTHDPEEALRLCDAVVALQGNDTASRLQIIPIPPSIADLGLDEDSADLTTLKRRLITIVADVNHG